MFPLDIVPLSGSDCLLRRVDRQTSLPLAALCSTLMPALSFHLLYEEDSGIAVQAYCFFRFVPVILEYCEQCDLSLAHVQFFWNNSSGGSFLPFFSTLHACLFSSLEFLARKFIMEGSLGGRSFHGVQEEGQFCTCP